MAAEQGNASAQYFLGSAYVTGEGVAEDLSEAARWLRMAAEQGHAGTAPFTLAYILYRQRLVKGTTEDNREAYI